MNGTFRKTLSLDELLLCRFTSTYGQANVELCFEQLSLTPTSNSTAVPTLAPGPTNVSGAYSGTVVTGIQRESFPMHKYVLNLAGPAPYSTL
jgi:hypothetical protein